MHIKRKTVHYAIFALQLMISLGLTASEMVREYSSDVTYSSALMSAQVGRWPQRPAADTPLLRRAQRLQDRVTARFGIRPELHHLANALTERDALLRHAVAVQFALEDPAAAATPLPWVVSLHRYPTWLIFHASEQHPEFLLDEARIRDEISQHQPGEIRPPTHAVILSVADDKGVLRAQTEGEPSDGYVLDPAAAADAIVRAYGNASDAVLMGVRFEEGKIYYATDTGLKELTLLATGYSNFKNSPWGRKANIRKGMMEHLHNVLVPQGTEFSFNATLGGPVSQSNGWYESLIIVDGWDLQPAPGGGICQVATTVYRSLVLAGLPVTERANHSLYVTYYKAYGVGIDATIFPKKQDLTFVNDTPDHLLFRAEVEGDDARVSVYGIRDGRTVDLQGPFFASTAPAGFSVNGRAMKGNEIAWMQTVRYQDGREVQNVIASKYSAVPKSLAKEYPASRGLAELIPSVQIASQDGTMHGAAPTTVTE